MGKLAVKLYHWHMKKTSKKESLQIKQMKYEIPPKKKKQNQKSEKYLKISYLIIPKSWT